MKFARDETDAERLRYCAARIAELERRLAGEPTMALADPKRLLRYRRELTALHQLLGQLQTPRLL